MKRAALLFTVLALVLTSSAFAAETAGNAIFVPVVSRTPGALGSEWRTDLVISNVSRLQTPVPFTITFIPNDGSEGTYMTGEIGGRTSYTYPDVVNIGFGRAVGVGAVHVTSSSPHARLTARARIYNIASPNGEFAQHVPGALVFDLQREHHLNGLSGVDGNRTNVGISNPWDTPNSFWISLFDGEGELRHASGWYGVAPRQVLQINDVFAWLGHPPMANATIEITTERPAYVYASLVRADSGDPIFVQAVKVGTETGGGAIEPDCSAPAPLYFAANPAQGWIVVLQDDTDAAVAAAILSQKYGFTIRTLYEHAFRGFTTEDVTHATIAQLRCEPTVKFIQQNENVPLP